MLDYIFALQCSQLVDSKLASTREFWRKKYFKATDAEASDPRPFAEVLAGRAILDQERGDG